MTNGLPWRKVPSRLSRFWAALPFVPAATTAVNARPQCGGDIRLFAGHDLALEHRLRSCLRRDDNVPALSFAVAHVARPAVCGRVGTLFSHWTSFNVAAALALSLALSACSSAPSPVTPTPAPVTAPPIVTPPIVAPADTAIPPPDAPITPAQPIPPAAPPPEPKTLFAAAFTGPNIGVQPWCEQDTPVPCNAVDGAIWGSFNRPGEQGLLCKDPWPNECGDVVDGTLVTKALLPGFPLITRADFPTDKPLTMASRMSADCRQDTSCWAGLVMYNGEAQWVAWYYSWDGTGKLVLSVWTADHIEQLMFGIRTGEQHDLKLEYRDGVVLCSVDGRVLWTPVFSFANRPHGAIFAGQEVLTVYDFRVLQ